MHSFKTQQIARNQTIADELDLRGYSICENFLAANLITDLQQDFDAQFKLGLFKPAAISQKRIFASAQSEVRRDATYWLQPEALTSAQSALWSELDGLKATFNELLHIGIWNLEGHYASYPEGGFYHRHFDRFSGDDARLVSVVLYLNKDWVEDNGGWLKLYVTQPCAVREILVTPLAGTLVCFLSDQIEHEVLESHRERKSFAGWFRRRSPQDLW